MNARTSLLILGVFMLSWGLWYSVLHFSEQADEGMTFDRTSSEMPTAQEERVALDEPVLSSETVIVPFEKPIEPKIWLSVPFVSQAPTGEWGKSEFQNGCEEASVLMANAWLKGKTYTKETAKVELIAMARYQEKKIGQAIDTDAKDTAEALLRGYFEMTDFTVEYDFSLSDLRKATARGLLIVPTNGRALKNPNFTLPGPLEHMLVVTGYDDTKKEFITNDPGTRKGENYRYPEQVLFDAIREYPTGKHLPITTERKAMIVVSSASNPASVTP